MQDPAQIHEARYLDAGAGGRKLIEDGVDEIESFMASSMKTGVPNVVLRIPATNVASDFVV